MFEVQMFIPGADNEGAVFTAAHDAVFEAFVLSMIGGMSWLNTTVEGRWLFEGAVFPDVSRILVISITLGGGAKAIEIARFARKHYRQISIYIRYLGVAEIIGE